MEFLWGRYALLFYTTCAFVLTGAASLEYLAVIPFASLLFLMTVVGWWDFLQKKHSVLGNYPLLGRFRFMFESIRPELRQYFWESDTDELPFSRNQRAMVYQRAKGLIAARPFGSILDMYSEDHNWLNHSITPSHITDDDFLTKVGQGKLAYNASVLNISGTSFGALSPPAIQSLSRGAKLGGFAHNTGEGSFSKYHEAGGGDTIWQISTGYFGCRHPDGSFDPEEFKRKSRLDQIKMIEIKLSQGAKPGHGGMLMAPKVTSEIAETRGIPEYQDCVSPSHHSQFSTPNELLAFVETLRTLSGGKPVGIKLCIGHPWEFIAIVKSMVDSGKRIDFVTVDGSEGGTGAAPVEFAMHLGSPLRDAVVFVDNCLRGAGLRDRVKVAASGKIVSAYDIIRLCALGSDWCNMARPFMFSIGCIQARDCASSNCPSGVATMNPGRYRVIDVNDRAKRVHNFHRNTLIAVIEMLEAAGLQHTHELNRRHIVRRLSASQIKLADQIYPRVETDALINGGVVDDPRLAAYWDRVNGDSFQPVDNNRLYV